MLSRKLEPITSDNLSAVIMIIDLIRRHEEGVKQDNQRLKSERIFP